MKEKKRPYRHPTQLTTKKLIDLLEPVFKQISFCYSNYLESFIKDWPEILGEDYVFMTEVVGCKQGILVIKVKNSSLYSLLYHHKKQEILQQIFKRYPKWGVKDIIFKMK